ncbi:MAG: trypsin-like peptidase domain-containing protein [Aureliella sp.]
MRNHQATNSEAILARPLRLARINIYLVVILAWSTLPGRSPAADPTVGSLNSVAVSAELKTVKLYGAGGFAGLDAYQSGFYISSDGHILTTWSTVLDVDEVLAVSSDGTRHKAELLGIDPNLEIAVLSTGKPTTNFFDLGNLQEGRVGQRVIAVSNLYGIAAGSEMSSIQRGVIMGRTELNASRGTFKSIYQGPVWILDATTNNPGATGGALVSLNGSLLGILGKELRDDDAGIWLNYAIPANVIQKSAADIIAGKTVLRQASRTPADRPATLARLGVVLAPNVLQKTPAYIDTVTPGSAAETAGLRSDDLVLFLNSLRIDSQATLREELSYIDRSEQLLFLVQRGNELVEIVLKP